MTQTIFTFQRHQTALQMTFENNSRRGHQYCCHGYSILRGFLFVLLSTMVTSFSSADEQQPEIRVGISAEEIFVGETIDYQVEIRNTETPSAPDVSTLQ